MTVSRIASKFSAALGPYAGVFMGCHALSEVLLKVVECVQRVHLNYAKCKVLANRVKDLSPTINQLVYDLAAKLNLILDACPPPTDDQFEMYGKDLKEIGPAVQRLQTLFEEIEKLIMSWLLKGKQRWGKFRQMYRSQKYEDDFNQMIDDLLQAQVSLNTALSSRTYFKLDHVIQKIPQWSAGDVRSEMSEAIQTDRKNLPNQMKVLMASDEEFKKCLMENFDEIKQELQTYSAEAVAVISREHERTREHVSNEHDRTRKHITDLWEQQKNSSSRVNVVEIPWDELKTGKLIEENAHSEVVKGTWGSRKVAIKQVKVGAQGPQKAKEEMMEEASLYMVVQSAYVVLLHGAVTEPYHYALVFEHALPSLRVFIEENSENLPWGQRWCIALQIAKGVRALHKANICHRALCSRNVLIGTHPRICRLSGLLPASRSPVSDPAMAPFIAPEIADGYEFTENADIFSLGKHRYCYVVFFVFLCGGSCLFSRSGTI